jgi:hypothetical protein
MSTVGIVFASKIFWGEGARLPSFRALKGGRATEVSGLSRG